MSIIFSLFIIYLSFSNEEIKDNPFQSQKQLNLVDYFYIYEENSMPLPSGKPLSITPKMQGIKKVFYQSYIYCKNFFMYSDELNNNYLLIDNKIYFSKIDHEQYNFKFIQNFPSDIKQIGFINKLLCVNMANGMCPNQVFYPPSSSTPNPCFIIPNPCFIIYWKGNNVLCFYDFDINPENPYHKSIEYNFDEASCQLINEDIYICAFLFYERIYFEIFGLQNSNLDIKKNTDLNRYENIILYDTSNNGYKILCARNKDSFNIDCFQIEIVFPNPPNKEYDINIINMKKNEYNIAFSYNEDNCNYTKYNSEYLICCGKTDIIYCERRDKDLQLIDLFNITFPGKIRNLTVENNKNEFVKLIYNNITSTMDININEYYIYPPKCSNTYLVLHSFQSYNLNLDDLFQQMTNTNYYITFINIPPYNVTIFYDDKLIDNQKKIKVRDSIKFLNFTSGNLDFISVFEIKYNISIDETYSSSCTIELENQPCYPTCKNCSQESSNLEQQFCLSCKEELGYYHLEGSTNCFSKQDMENKNIPYYFDQTKNTFYVCSKDCKDCNGPNFNNCLSCIDSNKFLYNGECILQCPNKTFPNYNKKTCENCHKNCDICQSSGDNNKMNCLNCYENYIFFKYEKNGTILKNCYLINENKTKNFFEPDISDKIISCKNFNKYIIENTNECIDELKDGYYISNSETNILSLCHDRCKSCNGPFSFNNQTKIENHNCIECKEDYQKLTNGSLENNCYNLEEINSWMDLKENTLKIETYKKEDIVTNSELYSTVTLNTESSTFLSTDIRCYNTCYSCDEGPKLNENGIAINHNCKECKDNLFLTMDGDCLSICPNNTYKFEQNKTCLKYCPSNYEINQEQNKCIEKIEQITSSELKSQIINNISSLINSSNSSKIINCSDFIAVIIPSDKTDPREQLKNGISAIDLGNCTNTIKDYYNISKNESFYILNIESKRNETEKSEDNSFNLGKDVQIEVFDKSGKKLDLSVCKGNIKIMKYIGDIEELDIQSALSLGKKGIDVFNANDDYFNDICQVIDNEDGKDIIIKDRRKDIYQNATFCQKGCSYSGMDYELKTAQCICNSSLIRGDSNNNDTNKGNNNEAENINFKNFSESIIANLFNFNLDVFKCHNLVFNLQILHDNIGFYYMAAMLIFQIICLFIFLIKRLTPIKTFMLIFNNFNPKESNHSPPRKIKKSTNDNSYKNNKKENQIYNNKSSSKFKFLKFKESKIPNIKLKKESNNNKNIYDLIKDRGDKNIIFINGYSKIINIKNPIFDINNQRKNGKKIMIKKSIIRASNNIRKLLETKSNKKIFYNDKKYKSIMFNKKVKFISNMETIGEKNKNIIKSKENLNLINLYKGDDDLQDMDYEHAVKYDKRSYFRIYWAFLVEKQIILLTFCTKNYLSLFIIKLSFLVCTFQISFFLNAFFYTDEYISDAYHNDGVLDFFSSLPKSIYSLLATMLITNILNILSNSKSELMTIIKRRNFYKNYLHIVNAKLVKLKIKLIVYFILIFILGAIFLYYVCSFCSVYKNSQKYWFFGCLESFGMDFLISIIICIFLSFFRYLAIKRHIKCFYILVNIINIFS